MKFTNVVNLPCTDTIIAVAVGALAHEAGGNRMRWQLISAVEVAGSASLCGTRMPLRVISVMEVAGCASLCGTRMRWRLISVVEVAGQSL